MDLIVHNVKKHTKWFVIKLRVLDCKKLLAAEISAALIKDGLLARIASYFPPPFCVFCSLVSKKLCIYRVLPPLGTSSTDCSALLSLIAIWCNCLCLRFTKCALYCAVLNIPIFIHDGPVSQPLCVCVLCLKAFARYLPIPQDFN